MRVAVIGGGIFGCTAAVKLHKAGYDVTLFEKRNELLSQASSKNQFRLHRGYHYPRSQDTVNECKSGLESFREEYGSAILTGDNRIYAIADGSKTSAADYREFCERNGLDFVPFPKPPAHIIRNVDIAGYVQEDYLDIERVKEILQFRLSDVDVRLGSTFEGDYDHAVIACYSETSLTTGELGLGFDASYVYELCEKPIVEMPERFGNHSIVIMDGPFGSIDPYGTTGMHLMGHVEHAIHQRSNDPYIMQDYEHLTAPDVVRDYSGSKFEEMRDALVEYVPALAKAKHVGSMFVVRAVFDGMDDTDARPTVVTELTPDITQIFSGKLPCCVDAATEVVSILDRKGDREGLAA